MQGSAHPMFDPLAGLRAAAAAREAAGLRRYLVPRAADEATLDLASNDYLGCPATPGSPRRRPWRLLPAAVGSGRRACA